MKILTHYFKMSFVLCALLLATSSCDDDDEPTIGRDNYLGTYALTEDCGVNGTGTYDITITANSTSENTITIANFFGVGDNVVATVNGASVTISSQTFGIVTYAGSGTLSGNILTLNYTATGGSVADYTCTATATKK